MTDNTIETVETQVPLDEMDAGQLKAARARVELLWRRVECETIWGRFLDADYNDIPIFEDERYSDWLASLPKLPLFENDDHQRALANLYKPPLFEIEEHQQYLAKASPHDGADVREPIEFLKGAPEDRGH